MAEKTPLYVEDLIEALTRLDQRKWPYRDVTCHTQATFRWNDYGDDKEKDVKTIDYDVLLERLYALLPGPGDGNGS
jgi:hypothetical protein